MRRATLSYDRMAWFYDRLAYLYSVGRIYALKTSQTTEMHAGNRVLYVGVGGGEDALLAAKRNVLLTILDLSPVMLERATRKFQAAGIQGSVETICCDAFKHERTAYYDIVVVNLFLDIFSESDMKAMLVHLAKMIKPGGKMLIGDYSYPAGGLITRVIQRTYYFLAMSTFWLFGGSSLHPIYNYPQYFEEANLRTVGVKRFRVSAFFPASFETITAVKV